jgi:N-acetyl-anhydromuramyl-L-alanine amidase AmpD
MSHLTRSLSLLGVLLLVAGCGSHFRKNKAAQRIDRQGDEIMVCGQLYHIGAPVVLWTDPGGYDAYRVERRFAPWDESSYAATTQRVKAIDSPNRYGLRAKDLTPEELERVRGGGWDLPTLQKHVDQFVLHYDVAGVSRNCFRTLQDFRDLSVHFMLDIDGTIYQTLDVKERAWHATKSNDRSVGIEIANMGAYGGSEDQTALKRWYSRDEDGRIRITIPDKKLPDGTTVPDDGGVRTPNFVGHPARNEIIIGQIHGRPVRQYDFTPQQYQSLIKLTAALCTVLPQIQCDYPRDEQGNLIATNLTDEQWANYKGVLGHFHVQRNKTDPGSAFQWDYVIDSARKRMGLGPKSEHGDVRTMPTTQPATAPSRLADRRSAR